jgi:predicted DsbA family dithiol-disulfide isomerase
LAPADFAYPQRQVVIAWSTALAHLRAVTKLDVQLISDVVCPWCFIGHRQLERALDGLDLDVTVTFLPFLLDPETPAEGVDLRERLRRKYGGDPEQMFARVEAAAHSAGLTLDFSRVRRACNTVGAHTLLRHALPRGTQRALAQALFGAYFVEGRDIGNAAVLSELAAAHGFTAEEARVLVTDAQELSVTRAAARELSEQGISGVPFFVFQGRYAVSGAQPPEVLRQVIARALEPVEGA